MNMENFYVTTLLYALISSFCIIESTKVKFYNVKCDELDRPFLTFRNCTLKALARDTVALDVHAQLHQVPVTNISANLALFQRGNGFRPFMYNTTLDVCKFFKHPTAYMFWNVLYNFGKAYTNVNHTCPYNHDLIIHRFILDASMLSRLPFPPNDYMVGLKVAAYNHYRSEVRVYIRIYD